MKRSACLFITFLLFSWPVQAIAETNRIFGTVRNAITHQLLSDVEIRTTEDRVHSDSEGRFELFSDDPELIVRLPGYLPQKITAAFPLQVNLQPFTPKALYLSYWAADSHELRDHLQQLMAETGTGIGNPSAMKARTFTVNDPATETRKASGSYSLISTITRNVNSRM